MHVLGHVLGVAADIEAGAVLKPGPEFAGVLTQAMLHIDLAGLVAGKSQIKAMEFALGVPGQQLLLVQEVRSAVLLAKDKPVAPGSAFKDSLLEKRAERRYAGAGAAHD